MHECAAPHCQEMVVRTRLMCVAHWKALPFKLRAAINAAWKSRERDGLSAWRANVAEARHLLGGDTDG